MNSTQELKKIYQIDIARFLMLTETEKDVLIDRKINELIREHNKDVESMESMG